MKKWLFRSILTTIGFIFASAGAMKLLGEQGMVERMNGIGFGGAWIYFIGFTEMIGVIGLFSRRWRPLALVCLAPYAIGGLAVHISHAHPFFERNIPAAILMILIPLAVWLDPAIEVKRKLN